MTVEFCLQCNNYPSDDDDVDMGIVTSLFFYKYVIFTSLSIERLRQFAVLEIVRSISPFDLLVPCCSRPILVRALAWARAPSRFIDSFCSVLPRR